MRRFLPVAVLAILAYLGLFASVPVFGVMLLLCLTDHASVHALATAGGVVVFFALLLAACALAAGALRLAPGIAPPWRP